MVPTETTIAKRLPFRSGVVIMSCACGGMKRLRFVLSAICILWLGARDGLRADEFRIFLYQVNTRFGFLIMNLTRESSVGGYFTEEEEMPVITKYADDAEPFIVASRNATFGWDGRFFIIENDRHLSFWSRCEEDRFYIYTTAEHPFSINCKSVRGQVFYMPNDPKGVQYTSEKTGFEVVNAEALLGECLEEKFDDKTVVGKEDREHGSGNCCIF